MNTMLKKAGLGIALAATALTTAVPANAQYWHHGYGGWHRGGDAAGAAVLGGIVGLGVGAAIASSNRPRYYYAPPPRPYYDGYYYDRPYYRDYPRCWNQWRWDPYWGRDVRVRVCD